MRYHLPLLATLCLLASCTANVPSQYSETDKKATVYPNYTNITIPYNIAPLNFDYQNEEAKEFITELKCDDLTLVTKGKQTDWDIKQWHAFLDKCKGKNITVNSYAHTDNGWVKYKPAKWFVAHEPIDPYISYRIIAPSYVTYEELTLRQRCIENFDESIIYSNMLHQEGDEGQCINCHSYKNYKTEQMQFHVRQHKGGTIMVNGDEVKKINLKTDSTLSAGVYPAWHPTHNLIAYSTNNTGQSFHTRNNNKIEVQDLASDLILYDVEHNEVTHIENDTTEWEVFPAWAPDGKTLYYCSAHYEVTNHAMRDRDIIDGYRRFHYNLYRKSFNPDTKTWGPSELVLDADSLHKSATLPRISPDGRYLLFGMADYGCFHIWHKDADLYTIDLKTNRMRNLREINSNDVESYHSWSSNGRWILFTSRRDDGGYTRLYIAYFDKKGRPHKPFILPQKDPGFYADYYKSYNVPEYMLEPVTITPQEFARHIDKEAQSATFKSQTQVAKN